MNGEPAPTNQSEDTIDYWPWSRIWASAVGVWTGLIAFICLGLLLPLWVLNIGVVDWGRMAVLYFIVVWVWTMFVGTLRVLARWWDIREA